MPGGEKIGFDCLWDWHSRPFSDYRGVAIRMAGARAAPARKSDMRAVTYALSKLIEQLVDRTVAREVSREVMALCGNDLSTFLRIAVITQNMPVAQNRIIAIRVN